LKQLKLQVNKLILLLDNYDSFTYNIYQYLAELGQDVKVIRNDKIDIEQIYELDPERIIISPGPCGPIQAGISIEVVKVFSPIKPLLGVCLGHQCVGTAYGCDVKEAGEIMHGKMSDIFHDGLGIFLKTPSPSWKISDILPCIISPASLTSQPYAVPTH
jgi:anthranilate synthase/aminodeoxychorismate synthase-like glutamine amidotransferase